MLFRNATRQTQETRLAPVVAPVSSTPENAQGDEEVSKAERRRQMYERIAQGNALAEAEDHARRRWNGR